MPRHAPSRPLSPLSPPTPFRPHFQTFLLFLCSPAWRECESICFHKAIVVWQVPNTSPPTPTLPPLCFWQRMLWSGRGVACLPVACKAFPWKKKLKTENACFCEKTLYVADIVVVTVRGVLGVASIASIAGLVLQVASCQLLVASCHCVLRYSCLRWLPPMFWLTILVWLFGIFHATHTHLQHTHTCHTYVLSPPQS